MTQSLLQLNPPIPLLTDDGRKCTALLVIDYGPEHPTMFLVGMDESRELWVLPQHKLRLQDNVTMGRAPK